jgi:cobyrinic acid a,c-diamide synthase
MVTASPRPAGSAPAAVLVAAPASGQGKTTVAAALARIHARRGRRVRAFKCGPDFLDPLWLEVATGAAVDSLDLWINGEADCARRLAAAAATADLVIVEGVMGLFDGEPSAADLARRFDLPVVAVIDAAAMAGTFGAVAHGLRTWRPGLEWAGVIANRVAGDGHAAMLAAAIGDADGGFGHLERDPAIAIPERHLGLVTPAEREAALARLDRAADALERSPLGARPLSRWPRWSAPRSDPAPAIAPALRGCRIAVAHDAAFAFVYPANLAVLQALGAEIAVFSPIGGDPLPDCHALWLPGGYPEHHAARLAARDDLRVAVRAHAAAGRPIWAECGGLMALAETLVDGDGRSHRMWGLLPGRVTVGPGLAAIGAQRLALAGDELRGHTFHWSRFETALEPLTTTRPSPRALAGPGEPLYEAGSVRASWFHPWFASSPAATASLFSNAPLGSVSA